MKLSNDYKLEKLDEKNLVLKKRMIPESGKRKGIETWKNISYYSNYLKALDDVIEKELFDCSIEDDLNQVRNKIVQLKSMYAKLAKNYDEDRMRRMQ